MCRRAVSRDVVLRGLSAVELSLAADPRAARLAPDLDAWRRRVERVGTVNYPSAAQRQGLKGNPVVEVILQRDGRLKSARHQRSSGRADEDYDQMVSLGEVWSTLVVSAHLKHAGIANTWFDARTVVRTDGRYRAAKVEWQACENLATRYLKPLFAGQPGRGRAASRWGGGGCC